MELANGYKMKTTFWNDFTIADKYGIEAVKDTYNRAFNEWKKDIVYMTELAIVLNHKIWQHYKDREDLAEIYDELWRITDEFICCGDNFTDDEIKKYLRVTD